MPSETMASVVNLHVLNSGHFAFCGRFWLLRVDLDVPAPGDDLASFLRLTVGGADLD